MQRKALDNLQPGMEVLIVKGETSDSVKLNGRVKKILHRHIIAPVSVYFAGRVYYDVEGGQSGIWSNEIQAVDLSPLENILFGVE